MEDDTFKRILQDIDQSRAEGNNTECVTNRLRKEHVLRPPFLDKVLHHFFFLWLSVIHYC